MQPTGRLRFVRREGDTHPVLQQEMRGFENEVWEGDYLIRAGENKVREWINVPEITEPKN